MSRPHFKFEDQYSGPVCGIDEVGRGPLAGPVVAAAVILYRDRIPPEILGMLNDSKQVKAAEREHVFNTLPEFAEVSIAACDIEEIDTLNIYHASHAAMKKSYDNLRLRPVAALVDGNRAPKLDCETRTIVAGDTISLSIAAASIMAKVHRDRIMKQYALEYPHYGWETNAGYGTPTHLKAMAQHGITPLHRRSFAPVKKYV